MSSVVYISNESSHCSVYMSSVVYISNEGSHCSVCLVWCISVMRVVTVVYV